MNCYASPESGKMNNEDTLFSKEKEQGVTDLAVEKASEESALYTYCGVYTKVAVKMLFMHNELVDIHFTKDEVVTFCDMSSTSH